MTEPRPDVALELPLWRFISVCFWLNVGIEAVQRTPTAELLGIAKVAGITVEEFTEVMLYLADTLDRQRAQMEAAAGGNRH
jgi:hypothetical protein